MPKLPTVEQGLRVLLKSNHALAPALPELKTAKERAAHATTLSPSKTLSQIRDEVLATYDESAIGHLLSQYEFNRDEQMATLASFGAHSALSLISQGALSAEIASALKVSYDTFHEFMRIQVTPEELRHAEQLGADCMVADGLKMLVGAVDKEDLAQAKAVMEVKMKIAKSMNSRYIEQKPSTAIQVNNYADDGHTVGGAPIPFLQIVEPRPEDLPELTEHKAVEDTHEIPVEPIPTEYTLFTELPHE